MGCLMNKNAKVVKQMCKKLKSGKQTFNTDHDSSNLNICEKNLNCRFAPLNVATSDFPLKSYRNLFSLLRQIQEQLKAFC